MTLIPPTPRANPPEGGGPRSPRRLRWAVFIALAVGLTGLLLWLGGRYPGTFDSRDSMIDLVRYGSILVLVASGILVNRRLRLRQAVRDTAIWAAIIAGLVAVYGFRDELKFVGQRVLGELEPHQAQTTDRGDLIFRRGRDGHFQVDARVNGQPVRFMVDTGASDIVLSPQDAKRVGINPDRLTFNQRYQTANGTVWGASTTIGSIMVGPIRFHNIGASVNGAPMDQSLLGLAFLDRLSGYEVSGDTLILKP